MYNNLIRIPVYVFEYVGYEFSVNNKVLFYKKCLHTSTLKRIQIQDVLNC